MNLYRVVTVINVTYSCNQSNPSNYNQSNPSNYNHTSSSYNVPIVLITTRIVLNYTPIDLILT